MRAVDAAGSRLLPVLPLEDVCLFPAASLALVVSRPASVHALQIASRSGGELLVLAQRESGAGPRDLHLTGTVAELRSDQALSPLEHRVELDGLFRARAEILLGVEVLVAEAVSIDEGDEGDEWGPAVEALARYLHTHSDLRAFLEQQRRSTKPMSWVNLACQHLPITASARQKLLETSARERCLKISRGLDALLRKEQAG
ncbi:MAG TPA: LON peptidase substrate-binding domain-containing protein [Vicinamibacteria bacterium]|nr:LON peptidase substrate-binding domain-containing protein [Vicinamibacteria bacterium]